MIGYDKRPEYEGILLDLPFYEGVGTITRDQAKPHHQDVDLKTVGSGTFIWDRVATGRSAFDNSFAIDGASFDSGKASFGLGFSLDFPSPGGVGHLFFNADWGGNGVYIECDNADCPDLDFMAGDYSLGCWFNWESISSEIIMGRYELNVSGWELYLYGAAQDYLTLRHHHAGTLVGGNPRSGCYSSGWTPGVWWFMGVSRYGGGEAYHYRNGVALPMFTGGMVDPETCSKDLVLGARFTKDSDFYKGQMWRPRIWLRALFANEWLNIFETERGWFGV